jgi:hypothetical protein
MIYCIVITVEYNANDIQMPWNLPKEGIQRGCVCISLCVQQFHFQMALQPGVGLGFLYNMPPVLLMCAAVILSKREKKPID